MYIYIYDACLEMHKKYRFIFFMILMLGQVPLVQLKSDGLANSREAFQQWDEEISNDQ